MWAKQRQSGFTIVELLIVVVVIAILAAISIVAYTGIQNRARNQQTVTAVRAYYVALQAYATDTGVLPSNTGCLGVVDFYTSNPCYIGSGTYTHSATLNNALRPYMSDVPTLPSGRATNGTLSGSGIFYYPRQSYIGFPIFSSSECPSIAGAASHSQTVFGSDIYCRIRFPSV